MRSRSFFFLVLVDHVGVKYILRSERRRQRPPETDRSTRLPHIALGILNRCALVTLHDRPSMLRPATRGPSPMLWPSVHTLRNSPSPPASPLSCSRWTDAVRSRTELLEESFVVVVVVKALKRSKNKQNPGHTRKGAPLPRPAEMAASFCKWKGHGFAVAMSGISTMLCQRRPAVSACSCMRNRKCQRAPPVEP